MSASKSIYPERPARPRPHKPNKGKGRPSSEHISGKRKGKIEVARAVVPQVGGRISYDKLDTSASVIGHSNPALELFMKQNRHNLVPIRQWGGRSTIHI